MSPHQSTAVTVSQWKRTLHYEHYTPNLGRNGEGGERRIRIMKVRRGHHHLKGPI